MPQRLRSSSSSEFRRLLADPEVIERYFREHLRVFFPRSTELLECTATHRAALSTSSYLTRYVLVVRERGHKTIKHVRGNSVDRKTWNIFRQLNTGNRNTCRFPRPLSYFARPGYIFYEEVAGDTLRQLSWQSPAWNSTLRNIGRALAQFHATPINGIRHLLWKGEEQLIRGMVNNISHISPARASWIKGIVQILLPAEKKMWGASARLIHKDFQASNIILGRPIGLIDFTLSGVGPQAFDLGTFAVHLGVMSLGHASQKKTEQRLRAFYDGYRRSTSLRDWKTVESQLAVFRLRSAIDILSITLTYLGESSANSKQYIDYLVHTINTQVRDIMTA